MIIVTLADCVCQGSYESLNTVATYVSDYRISTYIMGMSLSYTSIKLKLTRIMCLDFIGHKLYINGMKCAKAHKSHMPNLYWSAPHSLTVC